MNTETKEKLLELIQIARQYRATDVAMFEKTQRLRAAVTEIDLEALESAVIAS